MNYDDILNKLKSLANYESLGNLQRYGINTNNTHGISMPIQRKLAKEIGYNHELALQLWSSEIHEARIIASIIDIPKLVSNEQMENWVKDFDSWDVCDQVCMNLFRKTEHAYLKAVEWTNREEEFVKRAGFALMATLAVHDKKADDEVFINFLKFIEKEAVDDRNFVKKAINWGLRQIGKRNMVLNKIAIETAERINKLNSKSAKWIAQDAIRELTNDKILKKIKM